MTKYARERIRAGAPLPGVFVLRDDLSIGRAIEEIVMLVECSTQEEWKDCIEFLPF